MEDDDIVRNKRWHAEHDIIEEMSKFGVTQAIPEREQWALAMSIVDMLADAWDSGRSTGKYDALYQEPEAWEDTNPYREGFEDGE